MLRPSPNNRDRRLSGLFMISLSFIWNCAILIPINRQPRHLRFYELVAARASRFKTQIATLQQINQTLNSNGFTERLCRVPLEDIISRVRVQWPAISALPIIARTKGSFFVLQAASTTTSWSTKKPNARESALK
jgi:hypothetical protein